MRMVVFKNFLIPLAILLVGAELLVVQVHAHDLELDTQIQQEASVQSQAILKEHQERLNLLDERKIFFNTYQCIVDHASDTNIINAQRVKLLLESKHQALREIFAVYKVCVEEDNSNQAQIEELVEMLVRQMELLKVFYDIIDSIHLKLLIYCQARYPGVADQFFKATGLFIVLADECSELLLQRYWQDVTQGSVVAEAMWGIYETSCSLSLLIEELWPKNSYQVLVKLLNNTDEIEFFENDELIDFLIPFYKNYAQIVSSFYVYIYDQAYLTRTRDCIELLSRQFNQVRGQVIESSRINDQNEVSHGCSQQHLPLLDLVIAQLHCIDGKYREQPWYFMGEGSAIVQQEIAVRYATLLNDSAWGCLTVEEASLCCYAQRLIERFIQQGKYAEALMHELMYCELRLTQVIEGCTSSMGNQLRSYKMYPFTENPGNRLLINMKNLVQRCYQHTHDQLFPEHKSIMERIMSSGFAQSALVKGVVSRAQGNIIVEHAGKIFNHPQAVALALCGVVVPSVMLTFLKYLSPGFSSGIQKKIMDFIKNCDIHNSLGHMLSFFTTNTDVVELIEQKHPEVVATLCEQLNNS